MAVAAINASPLKTVVTGYEIRIVFLRSGLSMRKNVEIERARVATMMKAISVKPTLDT